MHMLSQEKKTFLFVHWCDTTHATAYHASRGLSTWLNRALSHRWTLVTRSLVRIELLLTIWNGYWAELGISFIMWTIVKRVELEAWSIKVLPKCWYSTIDTFLCSIFRIIYRTLNCVLLHKVTFATFVRINEYDTSRFFSNLTLLNFLNWGSFIWQDIFQRFLLINFLVLACNYIYWRCVTLIFYAYALRHNVHSLLIWDHWSPNFICFNLLHVLFASCYEDWVKLVVILHESLLITTTFLLPFISSTWWLT